MMSEESVHENAQASTEATGWNASCYQLAKKTQNPVYAWLALNAALRPQLQVSGDQPLPDKVEIPGWIANYLLQAGEMLIGLAAGLDFRVETPPFDPDRYNTAEEAMASDEFQQITKLRKIDRQKAMSFVPYALGLKRDGSNWNAFAEAESNSMKAQGAQIYVAMIAAGIPSKIAVDEIGKRIAANDPSRIVARVREGREFIEKGKVGE